MNVLRNVNWLSIDVACGAAFMSAFFCVQFGSPLIWTHHLCLSLAVWCIYTLDHLLDVQGKTVTSARRRFHYRYRHALLMAFSLASTLGLWLAWQLPDQLLKQGLVWALFCTAYLLLAQLRFFRFPKETVAALLYTGGVMFLPLFGVYTVEWTVLVCLPMVLFTAWMNLRLFSWYEFETDSAEGMTHSKAPAQINKIVPAYLVLMFFGTMLLSIFDAPFPWIPVFGLLTAGTYLLWWGRKWRQVCLWYRSLGDITFLTPGLFLL